MHARIVIFQLGFLIQFVCAAGLLGGEKTIGVFVALADNANQGIVPVAAELGNGEDPDKNLYWGAGEGLRGVFNQNPAWRLLEEKAKSADTNILRSCVYRHIKSGVLLNAKAYRGAALQRCLQDFENAVRTNAFNLVVFIGHNGLMDFSLPVPEKPAGKTNGADVIVLCCKSEAFFKERIKSAGGRPILLTTQVMYPCAFLLQAAADGWIKGEDPAAIRKRAGGAYAANQKISRKAALGVFAAIE
jgi:hypothetical protein